MNRITLRAVPVLLTLLLSGCATKDTPELVEEAQNSGDWTAVNARFENLDRADGYSDVMCPSGTKPWCAERIEKESCSCVSDSSVRDRIISALGR